MGNATANHLAPTSILFAQQPAKLGAVLCDSIAQLNSISSLSPVAAIVCFSSSPTETWRSSSPTTASASSRVQSMLSPPIGNNYVVSTRLNCFLFCEPSTYFLSLPFFHCHIPLDLVISLLYFLPFSFYYTLLHLDTLFYFFFFSFLYTELLLFFSFFLFSKNHR